MPRVKTIILAIALYCATALPGQAQISSPAPLTASESGLVLETLGHRLTIPMPDWLGDTSDIDVLSGVETSFRTEDAQALLEIYPKGESEALWTTLYGARVSQDNEDRTLADYRGALMTLYARSCKPELTGFFQLAPDDGDNLAPLGFVCGGYRDDLVTFRGLGEVMVVNFSRVGDGVAIVYQEWRGSSFDPADPQSWPVATDVVAMRAAQLHEGTSLTVAD